jgi:hypothetical protein
MKWEMLVKMYKKVFVCLFFIGCLYKVSAQSYEVQQLLLDWEKLTQMKQILSDLKTGYEIVSKGYTVIRDISHGNFNLHEAFLDGLWLVSPTVRKYWKIPQIINYQISLAQEYKLAYRMAQKSGYFNPDELLYLGKVYNNLFDKSLKNIEDLTTIITANQLRMSDSERLAGIDKIYKDTQDELLFLRHFNNNNSILALQRAKEQNDVNMMQQLNSSP